MAEHRSLPLGALHYGVPGLAVSPGRPGQIAPLQMDTSVQRINEQGLWSTYQYAAGAAVASSSNTLFAVPQGSTGQGFGANALSYAETNMEEGGKMPNSVSFDVMAFACNPYKANAFALPGDDLRNLLDNSLFAWQFPQVVIRVAPIQFVGAGGGVFGATADTGNNYGTDGSQVALNNGQCTQWIYRHLGVELNGGTTFNVAHQWGAYAQTIDNALVGALNVRICLFGVRRTVIAAG